MLLCGALLVAALADRLSNASVDLAHHYALVARLAQHWVMPVAYDPSLGEMNVYPRASHALAALVGRLAGSPLLGMQLTAYAASATVWAVLLLLLRQLPPRAAVASAVALGVLLWIFTTLKLQLHGDELIGSFFYAQLVGQAGALLAMLAALRMERAGLPAWWRYLLLVAAIGALCDVHLMPALELLAVLTLGCGLDLLPQRMRHSPRLTTGAIRSAGVGGAAWTLRQAWPALLAPLAGALLLVQHPGFAVMRSLGEHNGALTVQYLNSPLAFGLYVGAVALLSLFMLHIWRQIPNDGRGLQALGLKYIALYGGACSMLCLLQTLALWFHAGSDYAVKKYVYSVHTALLLELCMVPALLLAWHRLPAPPTTARRASAWVQAAALLSPALLAMALLLPLRTLTPVADTSAMVRLERQLTTLRDLRLAPTPGRYTYVARIDGVEPVLSYMFSIGLFGMPRNSNAGDVLGGGMPTDLSQVGHLLAGPDLGGDVRYLGCRRTDGPSGLALMDGPCLQAAINPSGQYISIAESNRTMPCTLTGFSPSEPDGAWSSAKSAAIACPIPKLVNGKAPTMAVLTTHAFLQGVALQRLDVRVNGGAPASFRYDATTPARKLELPLPRGADTLTLTLSLPDARTPLALGLGSDRRELGVMIHSVAFY